MSSHKTNTFLKNNLFIFIFSLTVVLSLSINAIFVDLKERFLSTSFHHKIVADIVYVSVIILVMYILIYLYKGSLFVPFEQFIKI